MTIYYIVENIVKIFVKFKGGFYYQFTLFFTVWFVAGPAMILLGNSLVAKWVREKVIVSVEHCVALLGHAAFLLLTRPSAHNKNFPYHVRTTQEKCQRIFALFSYYSASTGAFIEYCENYREILLTPLHQIGIMEAISSHTTVGNHTLDSFGHHGYGVSPANGR